MKIPSLPKIDWKLDLDLRNNPTLARIQSLPTAGRLAVWAVALLLAWTAVDQWSWSWARVWNDRADRIEQALSESRQLANEIDQQAVDGAQTFGPVDPPVGESEGAERLAQAVVEVVKKHQTTNFSYDARASTRISTAGRSGTAQRLSKVTGEVGFEATPEETAKILTALESSPAIEAISKLDMHTRDGERRLVVNLTVEAWVTSSAAAARRSR